VDASGSTNEIRNSSNYYTGRDGPIVTGGTITTDGSDTLHTFLLAQTGTDYVSDTSQDVEYLVIAGASPATLVFAMAADALTSTFRIAPSSISADVSAIVGLTLPI